MKKVLVLVSIASLALTIVPSFLVFSGSLSAETNKSLIGIGTLGWFLTAPFWMRTKKT